MYSRDRLIKAIDNSACLTRRQIDDYLQQKLFPEELYVVEMHLNECPFCNDAIDGFVNMPNANAFLSKAEDFIFLAALSATAAKPAASKSEQTQKLAPKKSVTIAENKKAATNTNAAQNNPFKEEKKSRKFSMSMGIAAGLALALGIWGISSMMKGDKMDDAKLADAAQANGADQDGMFNESSVNRQEDSIMNAKYGYQNQAPLAASAKGREYIRSGETSTVAETEAGGVSMAEEMTVAAAPAASVAAEKPSGFIGPVMPKEEDNRRSAATADRAKPAAVVAKSAPVAKNKAEEPKAKTVAKESAKAPESKPVAAKSEAKETTKKEVSKKEEKKASAADPAVTQAEKDFAKGLDLYNKKQYSASIMYFQSASKVKDFPKRKQAESYIKLSKNEVVNAERKKNSENK